MNIETIRTHTRRMPFRPFELHLSDGRILPVPHSEFVLFTPSGDDFVVADAENALNVVSADAVTRLKLLPRAKVQK